MVTCCSNILNILAVVVDVKTDGLYLLGTKEGLLKRLCAGNEFTTADSFIDVYDVPQIYCLFGQSK
jgi:hypothetical protein